jgi:excisionase family DNA binding protein
MRRESLVTARHWHAYKAACAVLLSSWPDDAGRSVDRARFVECLRLAAAFADEGDTLMVVVGAVEWSPMSCSEVAAVLDVSEVTVRSWCASGRLRARQLGTAWAIDPTSLAHVRVAA